MKPALRPVRIFLIGSEFFATAGGIQRVNCMLLQMLAEFAVTTPVEVEIFSFGDQAGSPASAVASRSEFRWHAFGHSRGAMARGLVWKLLHRFVAGPAAPARNRFVLPHQDQQGAPNA